MDSDQAPPQRAGIRDILAQAGLALGGHTDGMSDEALGKLTGAAMGMPAGIGQMLLSGGQAFGKSLGLGTRKAMSHDLAVPYGTAVQALVLALQAERYGLATAFDTPRGAYIECDMPRDFFSMGGTITLDVAELAADRVRIEAACEIAGQKFDWGKSNRAMTGIFAKTDAFLRRLGAAGTAPL
jgi:hypothetical protein